MGNILDWYTEFDPALQAARSQGKAVLLQFLREGCAGCEKMTAHTYSDLAVQKELNEWFIPVQQDVFGNREVRSRYAAYWTPSFYFLDARGNMRYFLNGYRGVEDFRVELRLAKVALDLPRGKYLQTIDLMDDGLEKFPHNPRAASMLFVRGMAEYLLGREKSSFRSTMTEICEDYPDSPEARMWPWMDRP